jgi:hypothetical protein
VDICGPKWPEHEPKHRSTDNLKSSNSLLLQPFSRVERVMGIEPALSAWEEFLSHRVSLTCNGIGGGQPLVAPTGLVLWPVCGPVFSRVARN